jgi:hypothetical protein
MVNNTTCVRIFNINTNVEFKMIRHESIPFLVHYRALYLKYGFE